MEPVQWGLFQELPLLASHFSFFLDEQVELVSWFSVSASEINPFFLQHSDAAVPNLLAPRTSFVEDSFSTDWGGVGGRWTAGGAQAVIRVVSTDGEEGGWGPLL